MSVLMVAVKKLNEPLIELLLKHGADVNQHNSKVMPLF
jgi:hypothetical protein